MITSATWQSTDTQTSLTNGDHAGLQAANSRMITGIQSTKTWSTIFPITYTKSNSFTCKTKASKSSKETVTRSFSQPSTSNKANATLEKRLTTWSGRLTGSLRKLGTKSSESSKLRFLWTKSNRLSLLAILQSLTWAWASSEAKTKPDKKVPRKGKKQKLTKEKEWNQSRVPKEGNHSDSNRTWKRKPSVFWANQTKKTIESV